MEYGGKNGDKRPKKKEEEGEKDGGRRVRGRRWTAGEEGRGRKVHGAWGGATR